MKIPKTFKIKKCRLCHNPKLKQIYNFEKRCVFLHMELIHAYDRFMEFTAIVVFAFWNGSLVLSRLCLLSLSAFLFKFARRFWKCVCALHTVKLYESPGGNQVDGLPPASSRLKGNMPSRMAQIFLGRSSEKMVIAQNDS